MAITGLDKTLLPSNVAVIMGGNAAERDISLKSGSAVLDALQSQGINAFGLDLADDLTESLKTKKLDFVFIAVHGRGGEDGTLQGMLDTLSIPYTGSGVLGSALAMDKVRSKKLWMGAGIPTAKFISLDHEGDLADKKNQKLATQVAYQVSSHDEQSIFECLGEKLFVKPAREGSSFGLSVVEQLSELQPAIDKARQYDEQVLIEQFIDGPEYTVALLEGTELPSISVQTSRQFYDYQAKYESNDTRYLVPSGLSDEEEQQVQILAKQAFDALGCYGWGRVDLMRESKTGEFFVLEANTVPGMTQHSLVPKAAAAKGIDFAALVGGIVSQSYQRFL